MALVTDHTLATYNSYVDLNYVALAARRLEGVYGTTARDAYLALDDDVQEGLILRATAEANQRTYTGTLNSDVLTDMQWPRTGLYYRNGVAISSDAVPDFVKQFVAERTFELAAIDATLQESNTSQTQSVQIGSLKKVTNTDSNARPKPASAYPSYRWLRGYVVSRGGVMRA